MNIIPWIEYNASILKMFFHKCILVMVFCSGAIKIQCYRVLAWDKYNALSAGYNIDNLIHKTQR